MVAIVLLYKDVILSKLMKSKLSFPFKNNANFSGNTSEIFQWLKGEFDRAYYGNRAPLTFLIGAAWFQIVPESLNATNL